MAVTSDSVFLIVALIAEFDDPSVGAARRQTRNHSFLFPPCFFSSQPEA